MRARTPRWWHTRAPRARPLRAAEPVATLAPMGRFGLARAVAAACAFLVACGSVPPEFRIASGLNVVRHPVERRNPAPAFRGESLRPGPRVSSADFEGKVGVVNFWGSWCGPCRKEEPILEALWKAYGPKGVVLVGVNVRRDPRPNALAFADEFGVTYPLLYDPTSSIAFRFGVRVMPTSFVIDRQGRIAATAFGAIGEESDLGPILDEELAQGGGP